MILSLWVDKLCPFLRIFCISIEAKNLGVGVTLTPIFKMLHKGAKLLEPLGEHLGPYTITWYRSRNVIISSLFFH